MNKYEEMSDEQLCEAVLKIKRPELFNDDFIHKFVDGKMLAVFHNINGKPCGYAGHFSLSWADMGPLLNQTYITVNRDSCQAHISSYFNPGFVISCENTNSDILRAAAIVYLMINDQ